MQEQYCIWTKNSWNPKQKAKLDDIVEKSLRNAAIWDELKDRFAITGI